MGTSPVMMLRKQIERVGVVNGVSLGPRVHPKRCGKKGSVFPGEFPP